MPPVNLYQIMLASPGDVNEERTAARLAVLRVSVDHRNNGMSFIPTGWEDLSGHSSSEPIQNYIDEVLLESANVVIVVFGSILGKGTVHELEKAIKAGKIVFVFLWSEWTSSDPRENPERLELEEYLDKQENNILRIPYRDANHLGTEISSRLQSLILAERELFRPFEEAAVPQADDSSTQAQEAKQLSEKAIWLLSILYYLLPEIRRYRALGEPESLILGIYNFKKGNPRYLDLQEVIDELIVAEMVHEERGKYTLEAKGRLEAKRRCPDVPKGINGKIVDQLDFFRINELVDIELLNGRMRLVPSSPIVRYTTLQQTPEIMFLIENGLIEKKHQTESYDLYGITDSGTRIIKLFSLRV